MSFEPNGYEGLAVDVEGETKQEAEANILRAVVDKALKDSDLEQLWEKFVGEYAEEEPIPEEELKQRSELVEKAHAATAGFTKLTTDSFDAAIAGDKPVLVDFWAEWCMPCHMLAPVLKEMSDELGDRVEFAKLNVDENEGFGERFEIMGIPTVILFAKGQEIHRFVGAGKNADDLAAQLEPHLG